MKRILSIVLACGMFGAILAPATNAAALAVACSSQYTVKAGDNLFRIGVALGVPWPQIASANNLSNPSLIFPGQVLCIPSGTSNPAPTLTPTPTATALPVVTAVPTVAVPASTFVIPTFSIASVVRDTSVTIQTANFPPNQAFVVTMSPINSMGADGIVVGTTNSGAGGAFATTISIPAQLAGTPQIAIWMQSDSGYYAFNWFWNATAP